MTISYNWVILQLDAYPEQDGKQDVVFNIHWRRQATDGAHFAEIYGSQAVTLDPNAGFTLYDQLTEIQVIGWLESAFGEEVLADQKVSLDQQIEAQINPPVISPPLPWA